MDRTGYEQIPTTDILEITDPSERINVERRNEKRIDNMKETCSLCIITSLVSAINIGMSVTTFNCFMVGVLVIALHKPIQPVAKELATVTIKCFDRISDNIDR